MSIISKVCACGSVGVGLGSSLAWAQAQVGGAPPLARDFEDAQTMTFQMVPGKASNGSTVELSREQAHSGQTAVKVHYEFQGSGYLQFLTPTPLELPATKDVQLGLWAYGNGLGALDSAAIRFIDAHNETFQYPAGPDVVKALNGDGWKRVSVDLDLAKPTGHWGDNSDGVPDLPMKFLGFAFSHDGAEAAAGSVYFDDLEFKAMAAPQPAPAPATAPIPATGAMTFSLRPLWPMKAPLLYLYSPTTRVSLRASVAVGGAAPRPGNTLVWTARDFDGKAVDQGKIALTDRETIWTLPPGTPGIWYLTAEVRDAKDAVLAKDETRVAFLSVAKSPTPSLPLLWGVNSHPQRGAVDDMESEAALTAALGFTVMRGGGANWLSVQPDNARQWNWDTSDQTLQILDKYHIKITQGFLGTPRWATSGDVKSATEWQDWAYKMPKNLDDLTNYLRSVVKRNDDHVVAYEIWNEPDISFWRGTPEEYTRLYNAARDAIKSVNPNALVMNGGFSETKRNPNFIPNFAASAKKPDIFAYHTHQQFSNLVRAGDDIQNYLQTAKWMGVPVWLNEAGFASAGQLTERDQASALIKKFSYSAALGYGAYFWYDLRNDGTDPNDLEHNFGLVRRDFTPKAAAVAARTLTAQIGGKSFVRRLNAPAGVYALLFAGKNAAGAPESTAVVWNEATNGSQMPLFWKVPGKITQISAMGAQVAVPVRGGIAITNAAPMPQFVTVAGDANAVSLAPQVLTFEGAILAAPGTQQPWKLTITNPLAQAWQGQIKLSAQDGWQTGPKTLNFSVPARGKSDLTIPVSAGLDARNSSLKVELTSPALPMPVTAVARLLPALRVPRRATLGTLGDFSRWKTPLAHLGASQIVSLFEATPMQDLHFHGDADLSADFYLARVPEGLLLGVRARDDKHVQNETQGLEWQGDSVQFALSLPSGALYEWAASLAPTGPRTTLFTAPSGIKTGPTNLPVAIKRAGDETWYEMLIPAKLPGETKPLPDQFRFSLLVNDNDGGGRKGWVEWTPGIGRGKDPTQYQPLVVQ